MTLNELISKRFVELELRTYQLQASISTSEEETVDEGLWEEWATSVLDLLETAFGSDSVYARRFRDVDKNTFRYESDFKRVRSIFLSAKADYEAGYIFELEKVLSGEIIIDFVNLAKIALKEDNKDVAAVLASAALEDVLKRYARQNDLIVEDKPMQEIVSALKAKGLVSGAQKTLLDTMPKLRDYAMHANWDKINSADVGSIIGFVEQFIISKFS